MVKNGGSLNGFGFGFAGGAGGAASPLKNCRAVNGAVSDVTVVAGGVVPLTERLGGITKSVNTQS